MLNSESIVTIRIKGEHLLYSKISGGKIGYGWGNVCYIVNFPPGEYLLYSKVSGEKVYYIANIPRGNVYYIVNILGESLLRRRFTIRHRNSNTNSRENHRHTASHWQILSYNVVSRKPHLSGIRNHDVSGDRIRLHR